MLPLHYSVLTFDIFFMHFPGQNEECSSKAYCSSNLKCVEGKCFRETEETTQKPADTGARTSKHITAICASTYLNIINLGTIDIFLLKLPWTFRF